MENIEVMKFQVLRRISNVSTQISLIGIYVPQRRDLSLLRTLWARFGTFINH